MSIEIVLGGIIVALLVLLGWEKRESKLERNKLINAILAKSANELRDLELTEKFIPPKEEKFPPDFIPVEDLSDEDFDNHIERELKNG